MYSPLLLLETTVRAAVTIRTVIQVKLLKEAEIVFNENKENQR